MSKNEQKRVRVTLVRSLIGRIEKHRASVHGLGLKRMWQVRELDATKEVMGMINKVSYLLKVEEI